MIALEDVIAVLQNLGENMQQITSEITGYDPETSEQFALTVVGHLNDRYVTISGDGLPWVEVDGYALFKALSYTELVDDEE